MVEGPARARLKRSVGRAGNWGTVLHAALCASFVANTASAYLNGGDASSTGQLMLLPLSQGVVDTSGAFFEIRRPSQWSVENSIQTIAVRQGTLVNQTQETQLALVQLNGTADHEQSYIFQPEEGKSVSDYDIVPVSSDTDVLGADDVAVSVVDAGNGFFNVTTAFEFDREVGQTDFALNFVDKSTGATTTSTSTKFTVAGISLFYTNSTGSRQQIGGENGNLVISTGELLQTDKVVVETFIQYLDGSNSTNSLSTSIPMSGIDISFSGLERELEHDQNSCSSTGGTYDGSIVSFPEGCGVGFSTNDVGGSYVGPFLGFDFETNQNGSFVLGFEWDELVASSDEFSSAGYETFLGVDITGEVAPIVTGISPSGPFSSAGGETIAVVVDNLPTDLATSATWTHALAVEFGSEDLRPATLVSTAIDSSSGLTTLTYTLPEGVGSNLSWTFTSTKPTGEVLTGADDTGAFTFTFIDKSTISSVSPPTGSTSGGTSVTIDGTFVGFNVDDPNSFITIGGTTIDKSLITSSSDTSITFTTPAESGVTGGTGTGEYDLTVTTDGVTSAPVTFTYGDSIISSLSPNVGVSGGGTTVTVSGTFSNFDLSQNDSYITIGSTIIDKSLISSATESEITFTTPPESSVSGIENGQYGISVTANGVTSTSTPFVYTDSSAVLVSLSPGIGSSAGGTTTTATGIFTGFDLSSSSSFITVGSTVIDKSLITSASETEIVFTTPAEASLSGGNGNGVFDVTITANGVTSNSGQFTFVDPPVISQLTPNFGAQEGGTSVTASGDFSGFDLNDSGSFITIGGTAIDKSLITSASSTAITFTSPAETTLTGGTNGNYDVVIAVGGISSAPATFSYVGATTITGISPSSGAMAGGTTTTLTGTFAGFDPASGSTVTVGGVAIAAEDITSFTSTSIVFTTPPHTSLDNTNSVFRFPVVVSVGGQASNSVEFVYDAPVILSEMTPSTGAEEGNEQITLTGQFVNFDTSTSGVFFGGKKIDDARLVSVSDSQIVFTSPPRGEIGSSFSYSVSVVIEDRASETLTYTYESDFTTSIDASGGFFNTTSGNFEIGVCGNTVYRANIPSSALSQNATFDWDILGADGASVLESSNIVTTAEVFYVPYSVLPEEEVVYTLTLNITTAFSSGTSSTPITRLSAQAIGVKIFDPDSVSPSTPNTTLAIQADVGVPGCLNTETFSLDDEDITYTWEYRGETYVFSHKNETVDEDSVGPSLLGREFKIPQNFMEYGTFSLTLTAKYTQNTTISGSDSTTVRILPAPLVAVINAGQSESLVSAAADVFMTGGNSWDPDVLDGDQNVGLTYAWTCKYGWDAALSTSLPCDDTLLASSTARDFTLSTSNLASVQNSTLVYIQYGLSVNKTSPSGATGGTIERQSDTVLSTLILAETDEFQYEPLERIDVNGNPSTRADPSKVRYFQDVIITPVAKSSDTTWTFELLAPRTQSTLLQTPDNLIPYSGFWSVGDTAGTTSLGILANKLTPGTDYEILIKSSRPGFEENEEVLELTTVQEPQVFISDFPIANGTTNDTYVISAYTNYDGDFKFYFTLTDSEGFESCVDGCQGPSLVRFRLRSAGSYQVSVDVYDSLGYTLLASAMSDANITVTSAVAENSTLSVFERELNTSFVSGNHGDFQQLGIDLVKYVMSNDGSQAPAEDSVVLAEFVANLNQIVQNSVPNSPQSAGFVNTVDALTLLTPDLGITYDQATLYYLVNITVNAVERSQDNIALSQLNELLSFYGGTTPELVLAAGPEGSSRRRLLQTGTDGTTTTGINILMADFYEVMKRLIAVVALKPVPCGSTFETSTVSIPSGGGRRGFPRSLRQDDTNSSSESDAEAKTPAAEFENPADTTLRETQWHLGHICNPEQGRELQLPVGTEGEVCRFGWCRELFEDRFKDLYFFIARSPNYPYLSRIRQNTTLTEGLYSVGVGRIAENNRFVDETPAVENCYTLNLTVPKSVTVVPDGLSEEEKDSQLPMPVWINPQKEWGNNSVPPAALYQGTFGAVMGMQTAESSSDSSLSVVSFTTTVTGIYSVATRIAWGGGFFSFEGFSLTVAEVVGTTLSVLVLVAAATVGAWLLSSRLVSYIGAAPPVEADFTYVERDVYGRGTAIDMMEQDQDSLFV